MLGEISKWCADVITQNSASLNGALGTEYIALLDYIQVSLSELLNKNACYHLSFIGGAGRARDLTP